MVPGDGVFVAENSTAAEGRTTALNACFRQRDKTLRGGERCCILRDSWRAPGRWPASPRHRRARYRPAGPPFSDLSRAGPRVTKWSIVMAKNKGNRLKITLDCTEAPGTSRYHTTKNTRTHTARLEMKKYNPTLRRHTVHREKK